MNREIKFRMWNCVKSEPSKSKMFYDLVQVMECLKQQVLFDNKSNPRFDIEYNHVDDGSIFMQFTGLLDKNGKEIYEGDILKIQLPLGGFWGDVKKEKIGAVIYESDCGGFIVKWEYSKNQHHVSLNCDVACEGEIIGNIYETPNLINP